MQHGSELTTRGWTHVEPCNNAALAPQTGLAPGRRQSRRKSAGARQAPCAPPTHRGDGRLAPRSLGSAGRCLPAPDVPDGAQCYGPRQPGSERGLGHQGHNVPPSPRSGPGLPPTLSGVISEPGRPEETGTLIRISSARARAWAGAIRRRGAPCESPGRARGPRPAPSVGPSSPPPRRRW